MSFQETLNEAKNYWNAVHIAADKLAEKLPAGRVYLFIEGTTGGAIVDVANGDTIDEQLVALAGDIIGGFAFGVIPGGTFINIALTASGHSTGDILKD